ncbi:nitroreductase family protein [Bacteriovorax sp. Seq25_V]|uniref:nitroreductase family protein n=1 Tax=Bacteriovorax sp. Seq25_V TaxID=1201288 RepID=UPI000389DEB8|nr:nitroreductase family protein [Bacteriovorax sp. Seq25_V]EQC45255.1 putative nitro/flavin reductase [Bacteriovorax sp. Seq25_V]
MNSVLEQVYAHRSIRKYQDRDIEQDVLEKILEASTFASTSGNMQAYSIIVTRSKEQKKKMLKAHFNQPMLMDAPVFLTFCADFNRMRKWIKHKEAANNFDNFMSFMIATIDATLASQNAALAAESLGLGLCYMGTTLASADKIGEVLKLPKNVVPIVGFSLGYADERPEMRSRLPLNSIVHYETYSNYTDNELDEIYSDKEREGLKRYRSDTELNKKLNKLGIENLAQIYTQLKYTEESHIKYSEDLLSYIKEQCFI